MAIARAQLVDLSVTRWYHCVTRCVRRAFLLGEGDHNRKQWLQNRLEELAEIFAVAVGGFSVMIRGTPYVIPTLELSMVSPKPWCPRKPSLFPFETPCTLRFSRFTYAPGCSPVLPFPRPNPPIDQISTRDHQYPNSLMRSDHLHPISIPTA
jgi:hypothetical protein